MYQNMDLTAQQIEQFTVVSHFLVQQFRRKDALDLPVTVKAHLLESHAPLMLLEYKRLNRHLEEPIEREHREWNELNRLFSNDRNWESRQQRILQKLGAGEVTAVQKVKQHVAEEKKRKFSEEKMDERRLKAIVNKENDLARLANTYQKISDVIVDNNANLQYLVLQ